MLGLCDSGGAPTAGWPAAAAGSCDQEADAYWLLLPLLLPPAPLPLPAAPLLPAPSDTAASSPGCCSATSSATPGGLMEASASRLLASCCCRAGPAAASEPEAPSGLGSCCGCGEATVVLPVAAASAVGASAIGSPSCAASACCSPGPGSPAAAPALASPGLPSPAAVADGACATPCARLSPGAGCATASLPAALLLLASAAPVEAAAAASGASPAAACCRCTAGRLPLGQRLMLGVLLPLGSRLDGCMAATSASLRARQSRTTGSSA
jgi:hypothetical protein